MDKFIFRIRSFLGVGAIGFAIDSALFFGLTQYWGVHYIWARCVASAIAITATWLMNRSITFAGEKAHSMPVEFVRYLIASVAGALANLAALSIVAPFDAALHHVPAYIIGAIAGLFVNFLLYKKFVFPEGSRIEALNSLPTENIK